MKLLITTDGWLPRWDGIVRFLLEIIPKLDYEIRILAPEFAGDYKDPVDAHILRFRQLKVRFGDIFFSGVTVGMVKEHVEWADLVFVQSIGTIGIASISSARKAKKPVVAYLHLIEWELTTRSLKRFRPIVKQLSKALARHYYNMCDCLICPTEEVMYKYEKNKIDVPMRVVFLGTDANKFVPADDKSHAKEKIGIPKENKVIGFTGRMGREKDLLTLYRAFRRIEKQHPEVRLLLIGKGVKEVEDMFTSSRNIIMPGFIDDVVSYLQAMDIFVMPSLTETTSLSTMEAMSCGLPVITTPVGVMKEYLIEKKNGMLFPFKNSLILSMKLKILLENEKLCQDIGREARKTIENLFSWEHTVAQIKEILDEYGA